MKLCHVFNTIPNFAKGQENIKHISFLISGQGFETIKQKPDCCIAALCLLQIASL